MNVFHFPNIVIELDVLFFGPHRQKEVLMSVERKTRNKKMHAAARDRDTKDRQNTGIAGIFFSSNFIVTEVSALLRPAQFVRQFSVLNFIFGVSVLYI